MTIRKSVLVVVITASLFGSIGFTAGRVTRPVFPGIRVDACPPEKVMAPIEFFPAEKAP